MSKPADNDMIAMFGFHPSEVGNRPRGWWVIDEEGKDSLDSPDEYAGASVGDLVIRARDGGDNEPDCRAGAHGNYIGTSQEDFDYTYRRYYYRRLCGDPAAEEEGTNG